MSIQSYLDSTFSSYEDLKAKVDAESARLKSEETVLSSGLESERLRTQREARDSINELKRYFSKLNSENSDGSVDRDHELPKLVKTQALPRDIAVKLDGVKSLLNAKKVLEKIREFEGLSRELKGVVGEEGGLDSERALELYDKLADLAVELESSGARSTGLGRAQPPEANMLGKLVTRSVEYVNKNVLEKVRESTKEKLRKCLIEKNWPNQEAFASSNPGAIIEFQKLFIDVLKTEKKVTRGGKIGRIEKNGSGPTPPPGLTAFSILAHAEDLRFKFHFEGDRATNRVDKPEWMFSLVVNTIDNHKDFLTNIVQPALILVARFDDRIAVHEFIIGILPSIYRKLGGIMQELSGLVATDEVTSESYVLSHLIHEIIAFDDLLKEKYYFTPHGLPHWRGVAGDILSTDDWFDKWIFTEKNIALKRFQEILDMPNSWEIDWDAVDDNVTTTNPTISALNIKDLFEGVTEHYSSLRSVKYRLRFLLEIQIHILDKYYDRLSESISAFDSMTSSLSRAVGGVSAEDRKLVSGVNGLERLCRIYGSLSYIINALDEWGEDLFFLDLWEDVSKLYSKGKKDEAISMIANISDIENDQGTLFDETIHSYQEKKQKVALTITNHLRKELRSSMQECYQYSDWAADNSSSSITPKLVRPIQSLSQLLSFLRRFQSANDYSRASGTFAAELSKYFWDNVIQVNRFSISGAKQLLRDVTEMWTVLLLPRDPSVIKLEEACTLLSVDSENITTHNFSDESIIGLKENLHLSILSPGDIRSILPRRKN